jgi:hypothetical protein
LSKAIAHRAAVGALRDKLFREVGRTGADRQDRTE